MIITLRTIVISYSICIVVSAILGLIYSIQKNNRESNDTAIGESNDYDREGVLKYLKPIHK